MLVTIRAYACLIIVLLFSRKSDSSHYSAAGLVESVRLFLRPHVLTAMSSNV